MENIFSRFAPLCAMVMKPKGDSVEFLGTAFAVHSGGYLATAAHLVKDQPEIVISPATDVTGYQASTFKLRAIGASIAQLDEANDLALLKFNEPVKLKLPEKLFGNADLPVPGTPVVHLGYPFGNTGALVLLMRSGILAAKVETEQQTKRLYVEGVAYSGAAGGPLIDAARGNIIGVVSNQLGLIPKPKAGSSEFKLPILTDMSFAAPADALTSLIESELKSTA